MAACAGHGFVSAAQGETAVAVMIEALGVPIDGHVAAVAAQFGFAGDGELPQVDIVVARGAGGRGRREDRRGVVGAAVAGEAGRLGVSVDERIACRGMVESGAAPGPLIMACGAQPNTAGGGAAVRIVVASRAGTVVKHEGEGPVPVVLGAVAGGARGGEVGALEGIGRGAVAIEGVAGRTESVDVVALLAPCEPGTIVGVAAMDIVMAVGAGGEGRSLVGCRVATFAAHGCVPTPQGVAGAVVIETLAGDGGPACRRVAVGAAAAQPAVVGIAMAIGAGGVGDAAELRGAGDGTCFVQGRVALQARNGFMASGEGEGRGVVFESGDGLPRVLVVALGADTGKCRNVDLVVTVGAGCPESHAGAFEVLACAHQGGRIGDVTRRMAAGAGQLRVLAFEPVSDGAMVETGFALGPEYEIVIAPLMLDMAFVAVCVALQGVEPVFALLTRCDLPVTFEALGDDVPVAELVTGIAAAHSFEMFVGKGQFSR